MALKFTDDAKRMVLESIGGVAKNGDLATAYIPYDSISLSAVAGGGLQVNFERSGETIFSMAAPKGWESSGTFRISGVHGEVPLTVSDN
ncbi:hypothetical protein ACTJKQ_14520 [Acidovorax sp. 22279]|uniref:hypothetical protein n=1 Tax=Acidovorax sp. 22279 TaxID=3453900 RepID=UPI003F824174